ncbi:MAG TPA: DUF6441 family protein [Sphingomonas sp.]|nr:DUF6441 family protein [Sphingomonas sp.]
MLYADLQLDSAQLASVADGITRQYLRAGKEAVAETTKWLERELEGITREAVPGRLWRAWASSVYPKGAKIARDPAGEVFLNGRPGGRTYGAMAFWSQPGRIEGKSGQWLAIPTPAAGSRGRSRFLTPGEWERRTGQRLRFVYRGGRRSALLVAEGVTNGRTGSYRPITRARTAADNRRGFQRGAQTVVIFVLVPTVAFANRISIKPTVDRAGPMLTENFMARVGRIR